MTQGDMFETLAQARDRFWAVLDDEKGMDCPCCERWGKYNIHHLNSGMACGLIAIHKYFRRPDAAEWLHVEEYFFSVVRLQVHDAPRLRHWGLIEKMIGKSDDGNPNRGFYRITDKGKQFARGEILVQQKVMIFDDTIMDFSKNLVTIRECLGDKFNYDQMMTESLDDFE